MNGVQPKQAGNKLEKILLVALLAWALIASAIAAHTYYRITGLESKLSSVQAALAATQSELRALRARVVLINIAINYGNGTVKWFNSTPLLQGVTVLKALLAVATSVEYKYGIYGAYITSVDGVAERFVSRGEGYSWLWYILKDRKWELGPVAADRYVLKDGDTIMWRYEHWKFP